jgi:hypothetical protein
MVTIRRDGSWKDRVTKVRGDQNISLAPNSEILDKTLSIPGAGSYGG